MTMLIGFFYLAQQKETYKIFAARLGTRKQKKYMT